MFCWGTHLAGIAISYALIGGDSRRGDRRTDHLL
jgi:hypothetical protein